MYRTQPGEFPVHRAPFKWSGTTNNISFCKYEGIHKISPSELSKLKQSTKIGSYEFNDFTVSEFCNYLLYFKNEKSVKQSILIMSSKISS